jgi:UDP-N-acetylmuramate--alanine ligase
VVGKSEYFVVEACEYKRSFLNIHPKILVITNIEPDHLDYYKDLEDIQSAFSEMSGQTDGVIICDATNPTVSKVIAGVKAQIVDYRPFIEKVSKLAVPGEHNRIDASASLAVAEVLGIPMEVAQKALMGFQGTSRRLEKRTTTSEGTIIYDDYAHHPTEIKASIQALRELYPKGEKKLTIVFQPHMYSRTKAFFDDFATSFKGADQIVLLPIYFARENPDENVSSGKLAEAICHTPDGGGEKAIAFTDFELAENYLKNQSFGKNDVFVTMGAGEAFKVADRVFNIVQ